MDWNHLEYFRVAGRLQHVTRAAEQLGMSQPALSRSLAQLEKDLGLPLFHRVGRSIRLTRYGELFLRRVERAHREIYEGRLELSDLTGTERGILSLGFLRTLGVTYVPQLVRRFGEEHPGITLSFTPNNSTALEVQLEQGELDLIFTTVPLSRPIFGWTRVADQELVLIVANSHRLARRKTVALREVATEPFVTFKRGHAFRRLTEELCAKAGFTPMISYEGDESSGVPGFVAAGFGVAIVPSDSGTVSGVASLRITEPEARRAIGIAWMKDRYLPSSAQLFRDFVTARTTTRR